MEIIIRKNIKSCISNVISRRTSARIRARGIVALSSHEQPIITSIYDIAPGGVSFLHHKDLDLRGSEIKMDILIYDGLTNAEYFICETKGRIASKEYISDPENGSPILRFGVEFLDLDSLRRDVLTECLDQMY